MMAYNSDLTEVWRTPGKGPLPNKTAGRHIDASASTTEYAAYLRSAYSQGCYMCHQWRHGHTPTQAKAWQEHLWRAVHEDVSTTHGKWWVWVTSQNTCYAFWETWNKGHDMCRNPSSAVIIKSITHPKPMEPRVRALTEGTQIRIRLLAVVFTLLGTVSTIQQLLVCRTVIKWQLGQPLPGADWINTLQSSKTRSVGLMGGHNLNPSPFHPPLQLFPRANSHNAGWTTSGTPQSLTIRRVCKTVQKCGSVAGRSTIPRCTIALHPDPSAAKAFMAPDRKLENVCSETVVEAMACKPLGQAAARIARIFSSYGDADNFSLGHMDCSAWIRTIWVALVCLRVVWTCAPNMRQLSTTVKPWSRRHWRPWLLVDHTKVFFWSKRRSNASMNWVRQWKMSSMRVGSVVMIAQSSTYEIGSQSGKKWLCQQWNRMSTTNIPRQDNPSPWGNPVTL